MDLHLSGKSVLITGASKGIGLAAAEAFAAEGCNLHLAARSGDILAQQRDALMHAHGITVNVYAMDLGRTENVTALGKHCDDVDILFNNAGDIPGGPIEMLTDADWRRGFDLKVFGYINSHPRNLHAHEEARLRRNHQ